MEEWGKQVPRLKITAGIEKQGETFAGGSC